MTNHNQDHLSPAQRHFEKLWSESAIKAIDDGLLREPSDEANLTAKAILDASFHVHTRLGPGLLERAYATFLAFELTKRGHRVRQQVPITVRYDGAVVDAGLRLDLLVNELVVVELKAVDAIHPVHHAQLITYLKLSGYELGLLLNFNVKSLKNGLVRHANTRDGPPPIP